MRKADMFRAMFSSLYTINMDTPEEDRDPKLTEYIARYMPNYGTGAPAQDASVYKAFFKFVNKKHKSESIPEDDAFELVKEFVNKQTEFGEIFSTLPSDDWNNLCDLIDMSNTVNAVNAMKDSGEYERMIREGNSDGVSDYIAQHPELMAEAGPDAAMSAMSGIGAMGAMGAFGPVGSAPEKKKPVHPNKNKKKKKKK